MKCLDFIFTDQGVDFTRINTYGFGEKELIASNVNSDGRKKIVV